MEDEKLITLISKEGVMIKSDERLLNFSQHLKKNLNEKQEITCNINAQALQKLINFYEIFDYDENELKAEKFDGKLTSDKLRDNFSKKVLRYLKCWIINQSKVDMDQIEEILEACYNYEFNDLKICLLRAIGTDFYCGNSENEIDQYKKKFGLPEEIHPSEQYRIINEEFKEVFDKLNEQLQNELIEANPKIIIPEDLKKDLERFQEEEKKAEEEEKKSQEQSKVK